MADDVVTFTTVRAGDRTARPANDINAEAVADQEERARIMARGTRDAILSARQRHALRRSITQGPPPDTEESPDPEPITSDVSHDPVSEDALSTSGGVQTNASQPSFAADTVRSTVGLPRLRSFLRGDSDGDSSTETPPPYVRPSHFEHVMMQAERIKERAAAYQIPGPDVTSTERLPDPSEAKEGPVVWDVDRGALDVAFARIRPAHSQPLADPMPASADSAEEQDVVRFEASPRAAIYQSNPTTDSAAMIPNSLDEQAEEPGAEADLGDHVNESSPYSTGDSLEFDHLEVESPRTSLWRSVNQRLRRRLKMQTDADPVDYGEPIIEDDARFEDDDVFQSLQGQMATGFHSNSPETWYDPDLPTELSAEPEPMDEAIDDGFFDDSISFEEEERWTATSEESWRLDEREFPEPQPAEWHRTRHELLSSLPPIESLDDSVQFVAPTPHATPVAPLAPRRPLPDPRDFFDISDPGGLAAFRVALFGSSSRPTAELPGDLAAAPRHADPGSTTLDQRFSPSPRGRAHSDTRWDDSDWPDPPDADFQRFDSIMSQESVTWGGDQLRQTRTHRRDRIETSPRPAQAAKPVTVPVEAGKCCATCRSFLPDEDGTRGRCTNEWASRHRSVVEADELACRSSFGDWWIAADSAWISTEGDPSPEPISHRQQAPRVRTRNLD